MNKHTNWLVTLICIAVLAVGCGGSGELRGADYEIPVYPQAEVTERDTGGFSAGESFSSMDSFDYVAWTLSTEDPMDKVVNFYRGKFPEEVGEALDDPYASEDEVVVSFKAPGMGPEDYVELSIMPGEISIMQITLRR